VLLPISIILLIQDKKAREYSGMNAKKIGGSNQNHLQTARNLAREKLKVMDLYNVARQAGGNFRKEKADMGIIQIDYLGKPVRIAKPSMTLTCDPDDWAELGGPVKLREEIFILHYLIKASGKLPKGDLIPFRRMDGGMAYEGVFRARSVGRLMSTFCNREDYLLKIGAIFGGIPGNLGSISIILSVLPHVELRLVLWKGDEDIPPSGNILFNESVLDSLPTEDCVVMAETVVGRITRVLNQSIDS